jgi:hypothetical protein
VSGTASGSGLPELELLLESSPGSLGADVVGNGCSSAAEEGVVVELGESGGGDAGFVGAPGNGNCSAAEGFFVCGGGEHGAAGCGAFWPEAGHGADGFCAGAVCAWQAAETRNTASNARILEPIAIRFRVSRSIL